MVRLIDIVKIPYHRNIYTTFAGKYCNIKLTKKREDGLYYAYISDYEAYKIYEIWINNYKAKREIGLICEIVKTFFETK